MKTFCCWRGKKIVKRHFYMLRKGSVNCSKQALCGNCMYGINTAAKNITLHFGFNSFKNDTCVLTYLRTCLWKIILTIKSELPILIGFSQTEVDWLDL